MKHLIKDLEWSNGKAITPFTEYEVMPDGGKWKVKYFNKFDNEPAKDATGHATKEAAMKWANDNHKEKMTPWLNPDPLTEYAAKFTQWAADRKIIQNGNLQTQTLKLVSEVGELADNIAKGRDTKDDIGDCFVVLNNLVEMQSYTWQECLDQAWNDIKDRKGYMNEHGVFIKEGDVPYFETWTDGHNDADEAGAEWRRLMEKD